MSAKFNTLGIPSNQSLETTGFLPPALQLPQTSSVWDKVGYLLQMTASLVYAHRGGWGLICVSFAFFGGGWEAKSCRFPFRKVGADPCMLKTFRVRVPHAERARHDGWADGQWMDKRRGRWMDEWIDGWMDMQMDGWTDR